MTTKQHTDVLHPEVSVKLTGENGNVFNLTAVCTRAAREAKVSSEDITRFRNEVTSSKSYDEALRVMMRWFDIR